MLTSWLISCCNNNNGNTSDKIDKIVQLLVLSSKWLSLHSNLVGFLPGFSPRHLTNFHETTGSVIYGVVFWWGSSKNTNTCQHYTLMKQTKPGQMYRLQIIRNLMQLWTQVFLSFSFIPSLTPSTPHVPSLTLPAPHSQLHTPSLSHSQHSLLQ